MTPREIAELIYSEFSPLSNMTFEESIDHVEQLIIKSNNDYHLNHLNIMIKHFMNENHPFKMQIGGVPKSKS